MTMNVFPTMPCIVGITTKVSESVSVGPVSPDLLTHDKDLFNPPTLVLKARAPTNASVILTDSLVMLSYTVICNGCCWDYISFIYDIVYCFIYFL